MLCSFSKKSALMTIWFSFALLASLDLLAATLFFCLRLQYFSSFFSLGIELLNEREDVRTSL